MPRVTVIVPTRTPATARLPVFDSLRRQTLSGLEILCLAGDGGPASARNRGLDQATGEYVAFCDDDDWIEPEMYAELVSRADATGADLVWEDYLVERGGQLQLVRQSCEESPCALTEGVLRGAVGGFSWNKLFRRSALLSSRVRFPDGVSYCEDVVFLCAFLARDVRVAYLPCARYHYVQHAGSLTNRPFSQNVASALAAAAAVDAVCGRRHPGAVRAFRERIRYQAMFCPEVSTQELDMVFPELSRLVEYRPGLVKSVAFRLATLGLRGPLCTFAERRRHP